MVKLWTVLLTLSCVLLCAEKIVWHSSLEEAQQIAEVENKNLFLYFTGSDWCPWCKKMRTEILENEAFEKIASSLFVFVLVDFPKHNYLSSSEQAQNENLRQQYAVEGFPMVVLVDNNLEFISILGYLPTTGTKYAKHLKRLLSEYKNESFSYDIDKLSEEERQKIYQKARSLGSVIEDYKQAPLTLSEDPFAHLQEYNLLLNDFNEEVLSSAGACLKEALSSFLKKRQTEKSEKAISPLIEYIRNFGGKDKNHVWQIEMLISQFFYQQGDLDKALVHAKACYKAAPLVLRKDLAEAIVFLKKQLKNS